MQRYLEPSMWMAALVLLFFMNASGETASLCLFKFLGVAHCPGCGLGRAVHHVLHGHIGQSLHYHVLGMPVTVGITYNVFKPLVSFTKQKIK